MGLLYLYLNSNIEKYKTASVSFYKALALFLTGLRTFSFSSEYTKLKIAVILYVTPFSLMVGY